MDDFSYDIREAGDDRTVMLWDAFQQALEDDNTEATAWIGYGMWRRADMPVAQNGLIIVN